MADYENQILEKVNRFSHLLEPYGTVATAEPAVFHSPATGYRMRAEFRVWHEEEALDYVMFDQQTKQRYTLSDLPIACTTIRELMPQLLDAIRPRAELRHRLFQVEFLANKAGDCILSLVYRRPLDAAWEAAAPALASELGVQLIGRSRKQRIVIGVDHLTESFTVAGREFHYQQIENSFTQPNATINECMLNWVVDQLKAIAEPVPRDFLELYCGNGNFTLPASLLFRRTLVTEISRASIRALEHNLRVNHIDNVDHARMTALELSEAITGVRPFFRLRDIPLADFSFSTMLVDPPRAGVDEITLGLMRDIDTLVYISCNPETLAANVASLADTHTITAAAVFDQFPGTPHIESGLVLCKKKAS